MSTITVPQGTSYVAGSLLSTVFLLTWQTIQVSKYRKLAGVPYPRLYAEKAEMDTSPAAVKFNCVQRAHANTLENIPTVYLMTILVGIKAPVVAASALGAWVISRIAYTNGYASGNPAQRHNLIGRLTYLPSTLTLFLGSIWSVYNLIADGI
ncbi:hypothetical protein R3P38DRAFT_313258 [Favolaschia claudopus]|uniref:Membrane-associated proteins in eicosanoid and glutathione metabolism n=1 Tax=Favolaschia claudopus TaxID=2862362 RepID=A0AAW0CSZ4_9AGAR